MIVHSVRVLALAGGACVPLACHAQSTAASAEGQNEAANVEEVVVSGKRVAGSAIGEIQPVAVLDEAAIRALGATSVSDLLKRIKPLTASPGGGDPVFLLNGRRISGFNALSSLPMEAFSAVEVLAEQDAARFGFPSTVRPLNFITKKRFRALAARELGGGTTDGGGETNYVELVSTRIDGPHRASLSVSHFRQSPVLQAQRAVTPDPETLFAVQGNVTGLAGGSIDPALDALAGRPIAIAAVPDDPAARRLLASYAAGNIATTDLGAYRTLLQSTDTLRVDGTFATPVSKSVDASLNLLVEGQRQHARNGLASATLRVPGGGTAFPFDEDVLVHRYLPDAALRQRSTSLNLHAGATLQGGIRRWTWTVSVNHDWLRGGSRSEQGVPVDALQAAVAAGGDPLMPLDPGLADERLVARSRTITRTTTGNAVINGPVLRLPAGDAMVTVAADYARSGVDAAQSGVAAVAPSRLARSTHGATLNAELPIAARDQGALSFMGRLSANGSLGVSQVSRFGTLVSAGYGISWAPRPALQLSAGVTDNRTPPAIALLSSPVLSVPNTPFFDFTTGASVSVTSIGGGNPALAPERRRVTTLGAAVKPFGAGDLRLSLDYVDTQLDNQSLSLGTLTPAVQAAFPELFQRDTGGRLVSVDLRPVNVAREHERQLRFGLSGSTQLGPKPPPPPVLAPGIDPKTAPPPPPPRPRPTVFAFVTTTFRLSDRLTLQPGRASLDLLDGATLDGTGGRPRWDINGSLGANYGPANINLYGRLQGPTRIAGELPASDLHFSGRTWLVLDAALDLERVIGRPWASKLTVNTTIENLLNDRIDVRDGNGATPNRFQQAYLDPLGRSIRLGMRKLF